MTTPQTLNEYAHVLESLLKEGCYQCQFAELFDRQDGSKYLREIPYWVRCTLGVIKGRAFRTPGHEFVGGKGLFQRLRGLESCGRFEPKPTGGG